jgi:signal peptide peptidase-like protein 3
MLQIEIFQYLMVGSVATLTVGVGSWMSTLGYCEEESETPSNRLPSSTSSENHQDVTLCQALTFPLYSSISLLALFFFFNYIQYFLLLFLATGASCSVYQVFEVLHNVFLEYRLPSHLNSIFPYCNTLLTCIITFEWIRSGNFWCHNILGCALCIVFITTLRFPSLKIAALCLILLLVYDMFWVFFSEYIFSDNVMVAVATKQASNPVSVVAEGLKIGNYINATSFVELPIKLIFPNTFTGRVMMIGLGDIALPGALVSLALRCDKTVERQLKMAVEEKKDLEALSQHPHETSMQRNFSKSSLFVSTLVAYFMSLLLAFFANVYSGHPQPALIYIVPVVLGTLCWAAYKNGSLVDIWNGKFKMEWSR